MSDNQVLFYLGYWLAFGIICWAGVQWHFYEEKKKKGNEETKNEDGCKTDGTSS